MTTAEGTVENTGTEITEGQTMLGKAPAEGEAAPGAGEETPAVVAGEEGQKPAEGTDGTADDAKGDGAPDTYEDFSYPEGLEVDEKALVDFKELAKDMNLSQEMAQKLVDYDTARSKVSNEANTEYYNSLMNEWQDTVRKDEEIGGTAFDESLGSARSALDHFATPELMEILETSGMGNHPEIVRVFSRIGKAVKEDKIRIGGANPSAPKDPAQVLFPNQT